MIKNYKSLLISVLIYEITFNYNKIEAISISNIWKQYLWINITLSMALVLGKLFIFEEHFFKTIYSINFTSL